MQHTLKSGHAVGGASGGERRSQQRPPLGLRTRTPLQQQQQRFVITRVAQIERPAVVDVESLPRPAPVTVERPRAVDQEISTLCEIWPRNAARFGNLTAIKDPHQEGSPELTFSQLNAAINDFAAGLQGLGLQQYDKVALFSENSCHWLVADGAILTCGGADVVRGATAPPEELLYIAQHSGSTGMVVQDAATLDRLLAAVALHVEHHEGNPLEAMRFVVLLWGEPTPAQAAALGCPVLPYAEVLGRGVQRRLAGGFRPADVRPQDLATLVYTSGTTGHPKGVQLTHDNLAYQVRNLSSVINITPGDQVLSLLPPWHIYERTCSYYVLHEGAQQTYTNVRRLRDDLTAFPPDHLVCVPLVLDTLHSRVRQKLATASAARAAIATALLAAGAAYVRARRVAEGLSVQHALPAKGAEAGGMAAYVRRWVDVVSAALLSAVLAPLQALASKLVYSKIREALGVRKTVISGGGSLAAHLDDFFEAIGVPVLNGWGLTETSPVLACRRSIVPGQNIRGSVGIPVPGTQVRVVDPETLAPLPAGRQGLVLARGPGVMQGYFRDPEATAKVFRAGDGWFDTGDLGWVAPSGVPLSRCGGHLVLSGRAKDTIVLSSGKNVEPQPIEDAVAASTLIKYVVLLGQDKRELGALVWPDEDALAASPELSALSPHDLEDRLTAEVTRLNGARPDYHPFDHVAHIGVVRTPLSVDDGTLTRTMKPRRPEIMKVHRAVADHLLHRLRG
ncbi:hypothetical protein HYH03_006799 [Edaphochlamys debaryana]|uniref:AMP-dependent synthetase/ligase domain-containing protein n=1 Tax=Edaphochlamys debaryana TaxID=47281 RepID=A0A836C139_9CHLO|nr:hypothetical protein HYH03_006799 [Edaphochlamys debaryana]|eukprot:KAG2495193.1 hypothetical protein HYH03_006799 [Edaphochlamys debaryana]